MVKTSTKLFNWANKWYEYSFNDKESKGYEECVELRIIINEIKQLEKK